MRKKIAFAASLALLAQSAGAWAADVGGRYNVTGTNFDGSAYTGTAEITVTSNSTCRIVWHIGASDWKGICMRVNGTLAAAYQYKNTIGLVHYDIKKDGVLDGVWTMADRDGAGTDVLTPQE
ncbi:MAG: hypothetical protein ACLQIQ_18315 [Beijerinckiaceae bacterium]